LPNATGWNNPISHTGSADYMHNCNGGTFVGVPTNFVGSQAAHGGNGYVGFATYYASFGNFREYLVNQLDSTLQSGVAYVFSIWVSLCDNCTLASDDLQFLFTNTSTTWNGTWSPMNTYTPTFSNTPGNFLSDKVNWVQLSFTFTATGGEQFLTIGNFLDDASTSLQAAGAGTLTLVYFYVDDLDLRRDVVTNADMLPLTGRDLQGDVLLTWTTLTETGTSLFEVERSVDDLRNWEKTGTVPAAGDSDHELNYRFVDDDAVAGHSNYYRLRLVDLNGETHFSNAIEVVPDAGADVLARIYPNPLNEGNALQADLFLTSREQVEIRLTDLSGRTLLEMKMEGEMGENKFEIPVKALTAGTYLIRLSTSDFSAVERIVVR
jgi:hypothetical protein